MPRKKRSKDEEEMVTEAVEEQEKDAAQGANGAELTEQDDHRQQIEQLQADLEQALAKANEYLDGWQRSMAEFANYKKRIDREQTLNQQMAKANVIKRFLDLFDDLDRAIKNRPQAGDAAGWSEGIELINRKFQSYLQNEGVEPIDAEGKFFDPTFHEAISQEDHDGMESGQIIGVVQQGYHLGDRVLRPARVRVAR